MTAVKLIGVGEERGVVLPRDMIAKLGLKEGDTLRAPEIPEGVSLTATDHEFATQMAEAGRLMDKWHNVLRELAK